MAGGKMTYKTVGSGADSRRMIWRTIKIEIICAVDRKKEKKRQLTGKCVPQCDKRICGVKERRSALNGCRKRRKELGFGRPEVVVCDDYVDIGCLGTVRWATFEREARQTGQQPNRRHQAVYPKGP